MYQISSATLAQQKTPSMRRSEAHAQGPHSRGVIAHREQPVSLQFTEGERQPSMLWSSFLLT